MEYNAVKFWKVPYFLGCVYTKLEVSRFPTFYETGTQLDGGHKKIENGN